MINIISSSRYKLNRAQIRDTAKNILKKHGVPDHEILNLVFVGKTKMRAICVKYKQEDVALPVLSFSYKNDSKRKTWGEVLLCYPQIILLAAQRNKKVDHTISQLIEHGINNLIK